MKELLAEFQKIQDLAAKRGLECIYANGSKLLFLTTPERFFIDEAFTEFIIVMRFEENTRHDSPNFVDAIITLKELEMSDVEWNDYIDQVKVLAKEREEIYKAAEQKRKLDYKLQEFEKLKAELGK